MHVILTTTLSDKYYHDPLLKMNRICTERLNYLPQDTQLDMVENNSKPSQPAFELNIKILFSC